MSMLLNADNVPFRHYIRIDMLQDKVTSFIIFFKRSNTDSTCLNSQCCQNQPTFLHYFYGVPI